MEIGAGGNVAKIIQQGTATREECLAAWEQIVKLNNEASGNFQYDNYQDIMRRIAALINEYNAVTASLLYLHANIDQDVVAYLKELGYKIDITSGSKKFHESLTQANAKSKNIQSKILSKQKELEVIQGQDNQGKSLTFEEVVANINVLLGFSVPDDITLIRYNQYRKILAEKNKQQSKNRKHG